VTLTCKKKRESEDREMFFRLGGNNVFPDDYLMEIPVSVVK